MFAELSIPSHVNPRISPKAKRLALRLNRKTFSIDLVIPKRTSTRKINAFVNSNQDWIDKTLSSLPQTVYFSNGAIFPFFGEILTLKITKSSSVKRTKIAIEGSQLCIDTYLNDITPRLKRWIRDETKKRLEKLAFEKASQLGKPLSKVSVRDTHTRWGSCGHKGAISFSWRLAFAPYSSIDYVVAHEVAHLKHMDHSQKFWSTCESLCEDYAQGKSWMRENGLELMRYCFDEMPQVPDQE